MTTLLRVPTRAQVARMSLAEKFAVCDIAKAEAETAMARCAEELAAIQAAGYPPVPPSIVLARQRSAQVRGADANATAAVICKKLTEIEALDGQSILVCTYDTAAALLNNEGFFTRFGRPWSRVTVRNAINRIFPQGPRRPGPAL